MVEMSRVTVRVAAILGLVLLTVSLASSVYHIPFAEPAPTETGSFDFILRTGAQVETHSITEEQYPLTHTVYDPGNTTIQSDLGIKELVIFYQLALGISLLENGSQIFVQEGLKSGARYDMWLDLNTSIRLDSTEHTTLHRIDNIRMLHMNESTSKQVILTRDIDVNMLDSANLIEFRYYTARSDENITGPTHEVILTEDSFSVPSSDVLNISVIASWAARFNSSGGSDVTYSGEQAVGSFHIFRNNNSMYAVNGDLKCFFGEDTVAVLLPYVPIIEAIMATGGVILLGSIAFIRRRPAAPSIAL